MLFLLLNIYLLYSYIICNHVVSSENYYYYFFNFKMIIINMAIQDTPYQSHSSNHPTPTHLNPPPPSECRDLAWESKALALALTSERLSLWYRIVVACDLLHPIWMARRVARLRRIVVLPCPSIHMTPQPGECTPIQAQHT